jgi:hypothetical protein
MKATPAISRWRLAAILLVTTAGVSAAFTTGGTAYTKRLETSLLAEPRPLATINGKVRYASKLKIEGTRGAWLRVSEGATAGWVFAGNLAETKPESVAGTDKLGLSATETTATAAARPLTPAANDYADRRKLVDARRDLDWLNAQCHAVHDADVKEFLQQGKKGEFQ